MNNNEESFIDIIIGPMFSGKTTKLINYYNDYVIKYGQETCLAINYKMDKRYTNETKIVSHDGLNIECFDAIDLDTFIKNLLNDNIFSKVKYIFINEAQFFSNLKNIILFIKNDLNKNIILCGLDLDFKREKFGELIDLIPYAKNIYKLTGKCNTENCILPSEFSHRLINNSDQLLIGNCYVPLCKLCYEKNN